MLGEYAPVELATLWKIKRRSNHISSIARYNYEPNPEDKYLMSEYVCPIGGSHIELFFKFLDDKRDYFRYPGYIEIDNINRDDIIFKDSVFNKEGIIKSRNLKREIVVFFNQSGIVSDSKSATHFLNIYIKNEYVDDIPADFICAILNKIVSGSPASMSRRINLIFERMQSIEIGNRGSSSDDVGVALRKVLPEFIKCEQILLAVGNYLGTYRVPYTISLDRNSLNFVKDVTSLIGFLEEKFRERDEDNSQSIIVDRRDMQPSLLSNFEEFRSLLAVKIQSPRENGNAKGYLILFNRFNDLATRVNIRSRIHDYFDWEDEEVANHISSMADMIFEINASLDRQLRVAEVISHELKVPTGFIYTTAERLKDDIDAVKKFTSSQRHAELNDILESCTMQGVLLESLIYRLQDQDIAPKYLYKPRKVDLNVVFEKVTRMLNPLCRRYHVDNDSIFFMGRLPVLHIDNGAIVQVFLNLLQNAIKYSGPYASRHKFSVLGSCSKISVDELISTKNVNPAYRDQAVKYGIKSGYHVSIKDNGIGVPDLMMMTVFDPGVRGHNSQQVQGAGLGLSIVRRIMRDHFGEVWVEKPSNRTDVSLFFPDILEDQGYRETNKWRGVIIENEI